VKPGKATIATGMAKVFGDPGNPIEIFKHQGSDE